MLQEQITREVRAELARRGDSQAVLAKALGWSPFKLSRRLTGDVAWSVEEVEQIASVLDVPRSQLLDPPLSQRAAS